MNWRVFCFLVLVSLAAPAPAHAYVDPFSGSVILQIASAGILAAAFTFKSWWRRAKELGRWGWRRVRGG
jgi:hypothetical protein